MRLYPQQNFDATSGVTVIQSKSVHEFQSECVQCPHYFRHSSSSLSLQATRPKPHSRAMRALSAGAISRKLRGEGRAKSATAGRVPREPG